MWPKCGPATQPKQVSFNLAAGTREGCIERGLKKKDGSKKEAVNLGACSVGGIQM